MTDKCDYVNEIFFRIILTLSSKRANVDLAVVYKDLRTEI
jgi:hypothetical protein